MYPAISSIQIPKFKQESGLQSLVFVSHFGPKKYKFITSLYSSNVKHSGKNEPNVICNTEQ